MANERKQSKSEPKISQVLRDDLRHGDFWHSIHQEFIELKEFMLTKERRERFEQMKGLKRWFIITWWLLKSLFYKLVPMRRLLVVVAVLLLFSNRNNVDASQNLSILGGLILLFVLMMELKDKLLAREELEAGRAIQKALMPPLRPQVPGWEIWLFTRSANEVGGDLVEFIPIAADRYAVALGDVAGKGLRAALLSAKLQANLQALAPDFHSLAKLATKLNQVFCRYSLPNIYASLLYLELSGDADLVRIVNAGHIPPIVVRNQVVEMIEKGGMALGLKTGIEYDEQAIALYKGDLLLLYSDGLSEAQNEKGEFFGDECIVKLLPQLMPLSIEQIGAKLVAAVDRFIGDARANDDLSIAILRRI